MAIRSDFDLDITDALANVKTVGDAIHDALSGAVDAFSADLNEALTSIHVPDIAISIPVDADTDPFVATIQEVIATAEGTIVQIPVDADTTDATTAVDTFVTDAAASVVDIKVTGDTSDLTSAADTARAAQENEQIVIPVIGDFSQVQEGLDKIAANVPDAIDIPITADTTDAESNVEAFGTTLDATSERAHGAEESFQSLGAAAEILGSAAGAAKGELGEASSVLAGTGASASALVGGAAAAVGAFTGLFIAGEKTVAGQQRVKLVFGESAEAVKQINVGGLVGDLDKLSVASGTSTSSMDQAIAKFGQLGLASGRSEPEVVALTQQIAALGLRAVTLNPSLGDAGTATDRLTQLLARGGPRLAQYGIDLSSTALRARALQIAHENGREAASQFDRTVAGLQLTLEKLPGGQIGADFAKGADQAAVKFKALKVEIEDALGVSAAPLVEPTIALLQKLAPAAEAIGAALSTLFIGLLPVISPVIEVLGEVVKAIAVDLKGAFQDAQAPLAELGKSVGELAKSFKPVLLGFGEALIPTLEAATPLIDALSIALTVVADVLDLIPAPLLKMVVIVTQVGIGVFALSKLIEPIGNLFRNLGDAIGSAADAVGGAFMSAVEALDPVLSSIGDAASLVVDAFDALRNIELASIGAAIDAIAGAFGRIGDVISPVVDLIGNVLGPVIRALEPPFRAFIRAVEIAGVVFGALAFGPPILAAVAAFKVAQAAAEVFVEGIQRAADVIGTVLGTSLNIAIAAIDIFRATAEVAFEVVSVAVQVMVDVISSAADTIRQIASTAFEVFRFAAFVAFTAVEQIIGTVISAVTDAFDAMQSVAAPALAAVAGIFDGISTALIFVESLIQPLIDAVSSAVDAIVSLADAILAPFQAIGDAIGNLPDVFGGISDLVDQVLGPISGLADTIGSTLGGIGDAIGGLFGSGGDSAADKAKKLAESAKEMGDALFGANRSVDDLGSSIANLNKNLTGFVGRQVADASKKAKEGFDEQHVSVDALVASIQKGPEAANALADSLEKAGSKDSAKLVHQLSDEFQAQAQAMLDAAVQSHALSQAQADAIASANHLGQANANASAVIQAAAAAQEKLAAAQSDSAIGAANQSGALKELFTEFAHGKLTAEELTTQITDLGVDSGVAADFVKQLKGAVDQFVQAASKALPTPDQAFSQFRQSVISGFQAVDQAAAPVKAAQAEVESAYRALAAAHQRGGIEGRQAVAEAAQRLNEAQKNLAETGTKSAAEIRKSQDALAQAANPQLLADQLLHQIDDIQNFQKHLEALVKLHVPQLVALIASEGPTVGSATAARLAKDPNLAGGIEKLLGKSKQDVASFAEFLRQTGAAIPGQIIKLADGSTAAFDDHLNLVDPVTHQMISATSAVESGADPLINQLGTTADGMEQAFNPDLTSAVQQSINGAHDALKGSVDELKAAAKTLGGGIFNEYINQVTGLHTATVDQTDKIRQAILAGTDPITAVTNTLGKDAAAKFSAGLKTEADKGAGKQIADDLAKNFGTEASTQFKTSFADLGTQLPHFADTLRGPAKIAGSGVSSLIADAIIESGTANLGRAFRTVGTQLEAATGALRTPARRAGEGVISLIADGMIAAGPTNFTRAFDDVTGRITAATDRLRAPATAAGEGVISLIADAIIAASPANMNRAFAAVAAALRVASNQLRAPAVAAGRGVASLIADGIVDQAGRISRAFRQVAADLVTATGGLRGPARTAGQGVSSLIADGVVASAGPNMSRAFRSVGAQLIIATGALRASARSAGAGVMSLLADGIIAAAPANLDRAFSTVTGSIPRSAVGARTLAEVAGEGVAVAFGAGARRGIAAATHSAFTLAGSAISGSARTVEGTAATVGAGTAAAFSLSMRSGLATQVPPTMLLAANAIVAEVGVLSSTANTVGIITASGFVGGLGSTLGALVGPVASAAIAAGLSTAGISAHSQGVGVGADFDRGFALGIDQNTGFVRDAGFRAGLAAKAGAEAAIKKKSPSQVGIEIGASFSEGLGIGILAGGDSVEAAATSVVHDATTAAALSAEQVVRETTDRIQKLSDDATAGIGTPSPARRTVPGPISAGIPANLLDTTQTLAQFVSQAVSQLPTAGAAISAFTQDLKTAFDGVKSATEAASKAQEQYNADLRNHTSLEQTRSDLEALRKANVDLADAQHALSLATDPGKFVKDIQAQNAAVVGFQKDLQRLLAEHLPLLAEQLAEAGPEQAKKLADLLSLSPAKARAAEVALEHAKGLKEGYQKFLHDNFADLFAAAGDQAGSDLAAGVNDGIGALLPQARNIVEQLRITFGHVRDAVPHDVRFPTPHVPAPTFEIFHAPHVVFPLPTIPKPKPPEDPSLPILTYPQPIVPAPKIILPHLPTLHFPVAPVTVPTVGVASAPLGEFASAPPVLIDHHNQSQKLTLNMTVQLDDGTVAEVAPVEVAFTGDQATIVQRVRGKVRAL